MPSEFLASLGVDPIVDLPADALVPEDVPAEELNRLLGLGLIEPETPVSLTEGSETSPQTAPELAGELLSQVGAPSGRLVIEGYLNTGGEH